jgi:hypothetical protein
MGLGRVEHFSSGRMDDPVDTLHSFVKRSRKRKVLDDGELELVVIFGRAREKSLTIAMSNLFADVVDFGLGTNDCTHGESVFEELVENLGSYKAGCT